MAVALLVVALLLSGCTRPARPMPDGQRPVAAIRSAVTAHGSQMPDGAYRIQRQKGTLLFAITAPRGHGACFSLEMRAAGLCHTFMLLPDGGADSCACQYTVVGGEKPLTLTGRIDTRAYPKPGSITADETADYAVARARELFEQYTPLLLDTVQEMLTECGSAAAVYDLFPGLMDSTSIQS